MSDPPSRFTAFLSELRYRRVFRVAAVYACVAFIIFQIIDATFEPLHIPDWVSGLIIILLLLGFLVAVGMAWAFDLTDKGIVRTRGKTQAPATSRRPILTNRTLGIVAALAIIVAAWSLLREPSPDAPITSIAVLPLDNLMNDPDQEYFVDGMHEALISELGKISALRVIGRTSAMRYKESDKSLPEIARELNVDAVVEGSVMRAGDQVRITAQLMGTKPERHLWTDNYSRDLRDILALQSEVARAIAKEIEVTLTAEEEVRLASARQVDPEAHEAYLLGRHYLNNRGEPGAKQAIKFFERALAIDSTYAPAFAEIAGAYLALGMTGNVPPEKAFTNARAAAEKALSLDEGLAEAHAVLASVKYSYDRDGPGAEREFKRALEINPNSAVARNYYAVFLSGTERHVEAIAQTERALELDPHYYWVKHCRYVVLRGAGLKNEALRLAEDAVVSHPDNPTWYWCIAGAYIEQGRYEEAIATLRTQLGLMGENVSDELGMLGYCYGRLGRKAEALKQIELLEELSAKGIYVWPVNFALVYVSIDDKDQAIAWMEKGHEIGVVSRSQTLWEYWECFAPLRDDPRFQELLEKYGEE